jgi:hypothetical protein
MELEKEYACIILPASEWQQLKKTLSEVAEKLSASPSTSKIKSVSSPYITAKEFMAAVRICRSSFDKLVNKGKIMTLKKGPKVYVVASEVERYFQEVQV